MVCRLVKYVWIVFCDGCKAGYSIRWKDASADERYMMCLLRVVSMGTGVMLAAPEKEDDVPI